MPALKLHGKGLLGFICAKGWLSLVPHSGSIVPLLLTELADFDAEGGTTDRLRWRSERWDSGPVSGRSATVTAPANWYPDPSVPHQLRYWDGAQWTQHVSIAPAPVPYAVRPRLFYAPTKSMAIASIAMAGCVVLLQLLAAVFVWPGNRAVEDEFVAGGDIMDVFTTYDAVSLLKFLLLFPAAYIVTCMWLWGVRRNAEALNSIARHVRERGWVWGSWVCPVVSLWFPFQIVRDVQAATNPHGRRTALIGWWWAAFLVLNLTLNAYSLHGGDGGDGYDLAEVKAFNAIAGIGEVIGLLVSLAAGTLWAAIVLRIERNQAALLAGR